MIKFFLAPYRNPKDHNYQHLAVVLAEGLKELGVPFLANHDHYFFDKEFLFKKNENVNYNIEIYTNNYLSENGYEPVPSKNIRILIDAADGPMGILSFVRKSDFNLILKVHYNDNYEYSKNTVAWPFGFTKRQRDAIELNDFKSPGDEGYLDTFRIDHPLRSDLTSRLKQHGLDIRTYVSKPYEDSRLNLNSQTGSRHDQEYYNQINKYSFVLAYGGYFQRRQSFFIRQRLLNVLNWLDKVQYSPKLYTISQFDSFRLWEVFISNSIPIHLDFGLWGFRLPVMPENGVHYLGIPTGIKAFAKRITSMDDTETKEIARKGKEWAIRYYSPSATADRFNQLLSSRFEV